MDLKDKLLRMMFPEGMLDYFEIVRVTQLHKDGGVEIELEEYSTVPEEFENKENYVCHGFYDWQLIHDHPLRGDIFNLKVHRRRWINKQTKQVRSRDWKLVAKGTSFSQEFADFLKELH